MHKESKEVVVAANPYLASLVTAVGRKRGGGDEGAEQVLLPRVVILRVPQIILPRRSRPTLAVGLAPVTAKP